MRGNTKRLTMLALFSAVAFGVMYLSKLIPINVLGFLTFDLKDVIIGFCGFIYGPLSAMIVSVVVSLIEMITISTTGPWGFLMNVLSTCFFICPAAFIYQRFRSVTGALSGLVVGALLMTAVMLLWNYLIVPIYTPSIPREAVLPLLVPVFVPFNLIKSGLNGALMMLLYKPVVTALRSAHLVEASFESASTVKGGKRVILILASLVALAAFILLALALAGKL